MGLKAQAKALCANNWQRIIKQLWCPEYAREYLLKHGMNYSFDDLLTIAKGQISLEDKYDESEVRSRKTEHHDSRLTTHDSSLPFFIDTDMYV